jgi:hypothetical protein
MQPLTQKTIETDAVNWLKIIQYKESGTVIQLQDDCEYRMEDIISNTNRRNKVFGDKADHFLLGSLSLGKKPLLNEVRAKIFEICSRNGIHLSENIGDDLVELFTYLKKNNYHIGLFISHMRSVLDNDPQHQELYDLELFIKTSGCLSVVLFSEYDVTHESYHELVDKASSLFQNVYIYPLYGEADVDQFIRSKEEAYGIEIDEALRDVIKRQCGGYLWLVSHILRQVRNTGEAYIRQMAEDDMLTHKLRSIWNKFTEAEQDILRRVHTGQISENDKQLHEYRYLQSIHLVHEEEESKPTLTVLLLCRCIEEQPAQSGQIQFKHGYIYYREKNYTEYFSDSEISVLKLFMEHTGDIVGRDMVAQAIWGTYWERRYSDWSIDSTIYRLRNKLSLVGLEKSSLKTVKSRGFLFEQ